MEEIKGRYLRQEEKPGVDEELAALLGDHYQDKTLEQPMDAEPESVEEDSGASMWCQVKLSALFLGLVCFIGVCAHFDLMDAVIAVPGMCVCSACFGWNVRWR